MTHQSPITGQPAILCRAACPICATPATRCRPEGAAFRVCPGCGLHFRTRLLRMPPEEGWENHFYRRPGVVEGYQRRRDALERIEAMLAAYAGSRRGDLLDVGCGIGVFLDVARRQGWRPHGVEPSASAVTVAREMAGAGLDVRQGDFLGSELAGGFAAVTIIDVLRHLPAPLAVLERARDLLAPGGTLLVREHNALWTRQRRAAALADQVDASESAQEWTAPALAQALARAGFRQATIVPSPVYLAAEASGRLRTLAKRAFMGMAHLAHDLGGGMLSGHMVALARRP